MSDSYYAMIAAKEQAKADGKDWDRIGVAEQDTYTNAEMRKAGYQRDGYMGAGAYRWTR